MNPLNNSHFLMPNMVLLSIMLHGIAVALLWQHYTNTKPIAHFAPTAKISLGVKTASAGSVNQIQSVPQPTPSPTEKTDSQNKVEKLPKVELEPETTHKTAPISKLGSKLKAQPKLAPKTQTTPENAPPAQTNTKSPPSQLQPVQKSGNMGINGSAKKTGKTS